MPSAPTTNLESHSQCESMAPDLTEQISSLRKKTWVSLQGLVDCSANYLSSTTWLESSPICRSISFLGEGSYNYVYRLVFDNDIELAASVSQTIQEGFNAQAKQSDIDKMKFVRDSGLYPDIPVPRLHAWDTTFNNPVGAPYVLMDIVQGEILEDLKGSNCLCGLDTLTRVQQLSVVKALAKLQASLSKPVEFTKIGKHRRQS